MAESVVDLFSPDAGGIGVTVRLVRRLAPGIVAGRAIAAPAETIVPVVGSFQPLGARELALLPEGMRAQGAAQFLTTEPLLTVDTSSAKIPDEIEHKGERWQVKQVDDWTDSAGYYRALLTRLGR